MAKLTRDQQKAMFAKAKKQNDSFGIEVDGSFFATATEGEAGLQAERANELLKEKKRVNIGDIKKLIEPNSKEPIGEFELDDILEEVNDKNIDDVIGNNIEYILKREKLWGDGFSVSVGGAGTLQEWREETKDQTGFYQFDFQVWKGLNHSPYAGTAYGSISGDEMLDMTIDVYKVDQ